MSAEVGEIFQWWCDSCTEGEGPFEQRAEARRAALKHDDLNHRVDS